MNLCTIKWAQCDNTGYVAGRVQITVHINVPSWRAWEKEVLQQTTLGRVSRDREGTQREGRKGKGRGEEGGMVRKGTRFRTGTFLSHFQP